MEVLGLPRVRMQRVCVCVRVRVRVYVGVFSLAHLTTPHHTARNKACALPMCHTLVLSIQSDRSEDAEITCTHKGMRSLTLMRPMRRSK